MSRPPLTAVPAQRSSLPVLQVRRRLVIGLLAGAACVGVASGAAWMFQPDPPAVTIPPRDESAISLATIFVEDFAAGQNSTVPAAEGVDTQFARAGGLADARVTFAGSVQHLLGDGKEPAIVERVSFNVAYTAADATQVLDVAVPMRKTGDGWVVAAAPTVQPASLEAAGGPGLDYSQLYVQGGTQAQLQAQDFGPAVEKQAREWAEVFASSGAASEDLFRLTGDSDSSHSYDGLGGWTLKNFTVKSYAFGENTEGRVAQFGPMWVTVRVALVLVPPGANGPTLNTEYDLLLEPGLNDATPPVTAWGPAGVGPTSALKDYVNNTNG